MFNIELYKKDIIKLCEQNKVKFLYLIGSQVNNQAGKNSDVDFLLDFLPDISIEDYTENYFQLQYKLRALLNKEIDIVTENSIKNPIFRESVYNNRQLIYAA